MYFTFHVSHVPHVPCTSRTSRSTYLTYRVPHVLRTTSTTYLMYLTYHVPHVPYVPCTSRTSRSTYLTYHVPQAPRISRTSRSTYLKKRPLVCGHCVNEESNTLTFYESLRCHGNGQSGYHSPAPLVRPTYQDLTQCGIPHTWSKAPFAQHVWRQNM